MTSVLAKINNAFKQIGYTPGMLVEDVSFVPEGGDRYKADLVVYASELRQDVDTALIAVKTISDIQKISYDHIKPFKALATPIVVLAEHQKQLRNDEPQVITVGLSKDSRSFNSQLKKGSIVPVSRFEQYLKERRAQFTPRRLETAKRAAEQLTLFDVCPNLLEHAFEISKVELVRRFDLGVQEILRQNTNVKRQEIMKAAIQFLGARILRDRLKKDWPLTDVGNFLTEAEQFLPSYFNVSIKFRKLIEPLISRLHEGYDLSQVSIDMVGEFYETFNVDETIRKEFGIHYTNSGLAKTMLKRMPIEEIAPNKRILWDPTCGSGNLLAAGYERMANAEYANISQNERHQKLVKSIFGNDRDSVAVMIARMTLMLFHPPHRNNWQISNYDAERNSFSDQSIKFIGMRPSIIVANPPFGGIGKGSDQVNVKRSKSQRDRAAFILGRCLDVLQKDGLMGIILPETILDQQQERDIRKRLIQQCQILEQWAVPAKWFRGVSRSAMVWILRKTPPKTNKVFTFPLSNVPTLWTAFAPLSQGVLHLDINGSKERFVPSSFETILSKMEDTPNVVNKFYKVMNGFRKPALLSKQRIAGAYPYSGNAVGTTPYVDLRKSGQDWVVLASPNDDDPNFNQKNQRKSLRKQLAEKSSSVLLRANRNTHGSSDNIKWSSIALIDVPGINEKPVAPSESFHAAFPKECHHQEQNMFSYALWAILNHPLASLYLHERQRKQWITIDNFRNFPLPKAWNIDQAGTLATLAEQLLATTIQYVPVDHDRVSKFVDELDALIYRWYGISDKEKQKIEDNFGSEPRPGLKGKLSLPNQLADKQHRSPAQKIDHSEGTHTTTCETLELFPEEGKIRIAIDGLTTYPDNEHPASDGLLLEILPAVMPGWLLQEKATGLIELTTWDADKLKKYPEKYIVDFSLMKNAYMGYDEIERELTAILDKSLKEANID